MRKSWRVIFALAILTLGERALDTISIGLLPVGEVGGAIAILKDAFQDDPIFRFHFPDPQLRGKALGIFFRDIVHAHMRFAHVYAAFDRDRLIGTAVWRPPEIHATGLWARLRDMLTRYRLLALSPVAAQKLLRGFAALEATHPNFPHWYLFFIGVEARQRGRGIGARLMAPVLGIADAASVPCYLETPFRQTLPFYRVLGYEITSEPRPFAGAPQLWAMTRTPRAQT
jgi:GNAT superfamily N-acetyltransferase